MSMSGCYASSAFFSSEYRNPVSAKADEGSAGLGRVLAH